MFSISAVVDRVQKKLQETRFADQDFIHEQYKKAMQQELVRAREVAQALRVLINQRVASNQKRRWVMVSLEDYAECDKLLKELETL